jgi:hypothetical protein
MSCTHLELVIKPGDHPQFQEMGGSGWWGWMSRFGITSDADVRAYLIDPKKQTSASPLTYSSNKVYAHDAIHDLKKGGGCQYLWLDNSRFSKSMEIIALDFPAPSQLTTVWRREAIWEQAKGCSFGTLYRREASSEPGSVPLDNRISVLSEGSEMGEIVGWLSPLRLRIDASRPKPNSNGVGQRVFWDHVLDLQNVLDILPLFSPDDSLRVEFYRESAVQMRGEPAALRSVLQCVVFGDKHEPNPNWFLILDSFGGGFQLDGFPIGSEFQWSWFEPAGLSFYQQWLAGLACQNLKIKKAPLQSDSYVANKVIQPSGFKKWRTDYLKNRPVSLLDGEKWHNALQRSARDNNSRWERVLAESCMSISASSLENIVNDTFAFMKSDGQGKHTLQPALASHILSARHLLPQSPVIIVLPSVPDTMLTESADYADWVEEIANVNLLDVVHSVIWPERDWPRGLVAKIDETASESTWPALGVTWHACFYRSIYERPASFRLKGWEYRRISRLGKTKLSNFILGKRRQDEVVAAFKLP